MKWLSMGVLAASIIIGTSGCGKKGLETVEVEERDSTFLKDEEFQKTIRDLNLRSMVNSAEMLIWSLDLAPGRETGTAGQTAVFDSCITIRVVRALDSQNNRIEDSVVVSGFPYGDIVINKKTTYGKRDGTATIQLMKAGKEQDFGETLGIERMGILTRVVTGYICNWISDIMRQKEAVKRMSEGIMKCGGLQGNKPTKLRL